MHLLAFLCELFINARTLITLTSGNILCLQPALLEGKVVTHLKETLKRHIVIITFTHSRVKWA